MMRTLYRHLFWCNLLPQRPVKNALLVGVAHAVVIETYNRVFGEFVDGRFISPRTRWTLVDPLGGDGVIPKRGAEFISDYTGEPFDLTILDGWENGQLCDEFLSKKFSKSLSKVSKSFTVNMLNRQVDDLTYFTDDWVRLDSAVVGTNTVVSFQRRG